MCLELLWLTALKWGPKWFSAVKYKYNIKNAYIVQDLKSEVNAEMP